MLDGTKEYIRNKFERPDDEEKGLCQHLAHNFIAIAKQNRARRGTNLQLGGVNAAATLAPQVGTSTCTAIVEAGAVPATRGPAKCSASLLMEDDARFHRLRGVRRNHSLQLCRPRVQDTSIRGRLKCTTTSEQGKVYLLVNGIRRMRPLRCGIGGVSINSIRLPMSHFQTRFNTYSKNCL